MPHHYHTIFSQVAEKITSLNHTKDESTENLYLNIIKNLGPDNDYTFQQIMLEYLSEFQIKSLFFYHRNLIGHNGFHVKKKSDHLVVTEVNEDTRLVVGDNITAMSDDLIPVLETRYKKLLFHEVDAQQDWTHIIDKQSKLDVLRGEEQYQLEVKRFQSFPDNTISRYETYQIVTIYNFDDTVDYKNDLPVILDLRYARGITAQNYDADVILISSQTKGSPELYASQSDAYKIGETTFGAANIYETMHFDDFIFVYGIEEDGTATPDEYIEHDAIYDDVLSAAKRKILS
ncbi:hypothetical protein ACMGE5_10130 [Macrococcus equi]|uniref:hypothetical protein n=1 Tax=Macrococcus equi TaxID=3395462 RepID=UPI0039BE61E3